MQTFCMEQKGKIPMTPIQTFQRLRPAAQKIITDYARRRGIAPDGLNEFLHPNWQLERGPLPQIEQFIGRLTSAVNNQEPILIFGDYDADGITATAILLRCLRETVGIEPRWALPNRQHDHYGLDLEKARSLFAQHQPKLLVCLDNGTNSQAAIAWLRQQGVETLVVDHHPLEGTSPGATALVNPKTHGNDRDDCCAAGLTLQVCHQLTQTWQVASKWDRATAMLLAGLGTVADAVSMTPMNRVIIRETIALLNNPCNLEPIPGLKALLSSVVGELNQRRLQFEVIPALNAPGRLGSAEPVVTLLTTGDPTTTETIAAYCREQNELRKQIQREVVRQAKALADVVVSDHPDTPVLVLAAPSWHCGVTGPAASQVAEAYQRSVILLARHGEKQWKGSGRSANAEHLGQWLHTVKQLGLVERGGGHARAVGLAATDAQIAALQSTGLVLPVPQTHHEPEAEVIGDLDELRAEEWATVIALLAPFGRGNPFPRIRALSAVCQSDSTALTAKDTGIPWAMRAKFKTTAGKTFTVVWRECAQAQHQWRAGGWSDLTLEQTVQTKPEKTFYHWSVISCRPREPTG